MSQLLKISPTMLNDYAIYEYEKYNGILDKQGLIKRWTEKEPPTEKMERGTAYHSLFEHGPENYYNPKTNMYDVPVESGNVYTFSKEIALPAYEFRKQRPLAVYELYDRTVYNVDGQLVVCSKKIDCLNLGVVTDFKVTDRGNYTDYWGSFQHYCYLDAFDDVFQFEIRTYKINESKNTVKETSYIFGREDDMRNKIIDQMRKVLFFLFSNKIESYVTTEFTGMERVRY